VIDRAKRILEIEAEAILNLRNKLNKDFNKSVDMLLNCEGKVIVTGMGKSGLVSNKLASTLACSGTPAFFLHPAEAVHGDVGMIAKHDVVIAISNSGETEEVVRILPIIKRKGIKLIVMTGNLNSTLAKNGDAVLDIGVKEEACPLGLVPTASTAATMAIGDALAVTVLEERGFGEEDFAVLHPGGTLGKKLLLKVEDLMHSGDSVPVVLEDDSMEKTLLEMTSKRFGMTAVCNRDEELMGIITDGDLRRGLERKQNFLLTKAGDVMTTSPKLIAKSELAAKALRIMEEHSITSLFIPSDQDPKKISGVIHLHDILKAGIV
jgi:arabinose-5-phosphate isomerase